MTKIAPAPLPTDPGVLLLDDGGGLVAATAPASALLELVADPGALPGVLRALHARTASGPGERPVVTAMPLRSHGRLVLHGARAGRRMTVIVQAHDRAQAPAWPAGVTPREREVLDLLVLGLPTKRIAALLQISPWTVTDHIKSLFAKTGVTRRAELMALVLDHAPAA